MLWPYFLGLELSKRSKTRAISWFTTKGRGFPGRGFGLHLGWGGGKGTTMAEKTREKQPAGLSHRPAL